LNKSKESKKGKGGKAIITGKEKQRGQGMDVLRKKRQIKGGGNNLPWNRHKKHWRRPNKGEVLVW